MTSDTKLLFMLERVKIPSIYVLDKVQHTYTCGRAKTSQIICLSLTVSRNHCLFYRTENEVYVTDLKSANGLYINGIFQEPLQMIKLNPNDIIGIGCSDVEKIDESMFVFKLIAIPQLPGSTNSCDSINANNKPDRIVMRKRERKSSNAIVIPPKVPRLDDNTNMENISVQGKSKENDNNSIDNDIEIIHVSLNNNPLTENNSTNKTSTPEASKSQCMSATEFESSSSNQSIKSDPSVDNEKSLIKSLSSKHLPAPSISKDINNKEKTDIFYETGSKSVGHIQEPTKYNLAHRDNIERQVKGNNNCDLRSEPMEVNDVKITKCKAQNIYSSSEPNTISRINESSNKETSFATEDYDQMNFICTKEGLIKLEDELQLTDEDDENEIINSSRSNLQPVISPIKLKQVPQELRTTFSENDVVNLSDDEDDVFPCSQLFDVEYGMDVSIKSEIKEEPTEAENERLTASMHDDLNLVISLSDSEDENNNPWLRRLSQSQKLNENEIDTEKKYDINIEAAVDESIVKPTSTTTTTADVMTSEDKIMGQSLKEKRAGVFQIQNSLNQALLPHVCLERIKIPSNRFDKLTGDVQDHSTKTEEKGKEDAIDKLVSKAKGTASKKKDLLKKKVPEIEAPHLPIKRGQAFKKVIENLEKSDRSSKHALNSKEQREEQRRLKKLELKEHAIQEKIRKQRYKWADCLPPIKLGTGEKKIKFLTREEKEALSNDRKLKLKKLAMEKRSSLEENQEKKRPVSKPKAKVTFKSRNDFLVEQTIFASKPEDLLKNSKSSSSEVPSKNISSNEQNLKEPTKNPETSTEILTHLQNKLMLNDISNLGKIPKKSNTDIVSQEAALDAVAVEENLKNLSLENRTKKTKDIEVKNKSRSVLKKTDGKGHSVSAERNSERSITKPKKRVSFSAVIKTVREYEIDEKNVLRKLVGKDAPIPRDKVVPNTVAYTNLYDEFLSRIFCWNPVWLEEQKRFKSTPPVIDVKKELNIMLTSYRTYEEYCRTINPLLLIEIWYGITKEYESDQIRRRTFVCSIVDNSISRSTPSPNICFTTLMIAMLVSKEDIRLTTHPVYGDLVMIEYAYNHEYKGLSFHRVFAFVTQVDSRPLTSQTRFNRSLLQHEKNPQALNTYTILTRPLTDNILVNRFIRLRTVSYLRPSLRMVKALQHLPHSPLMNQILSPKLDMYKLPDVIKTEQLVNEANLNQKQLEAVTKITQTVIQRENKLCFIHGPPGTGKSKVIVNIITQILYGNNRYTTCGGKPFKLLVCAPTNAAIDEIVLRLLDVRSDIKQKAKMKPFKMVRIGRTETMHPLVKDISINALADRDLRNRVATSNHISAQSMEDEKVLLESKMNSIKGQLTCNSISEIHKRHLRMKLSDLVVKYDSLLNPRLHGSAEERRRLQRAAEDRLLEYADIITCTLTSCCTNQMEAIFGINKERISVCIVDEATQSSEPETLIPLMLGVNTMILVGDPDQLPATIISQEAKKYGLGRSLFSRIQSAFDIYPDNPIIMLNTQYRMQPDICCWPNNFFYGGKLVNGVECNDKFPFHSYRILDLNSNQNNDSFSNDDEANFIANVIYSMLTSTNLDKWNCCISCGVLTPYNNQKSVIQTKIENKTSSLPEVMRKKMKIEINTVDGFQGQERDIIIMSCVRSEKIGFLSDKQRLCVALTRAKQSLIVCGNFKVFMRDYMWNSFLSDARSRKMYFKVSAKAEPPEIRSYIVRHAPESHDNRVKV